MAAAGKAEAGGHGLLRRFVGVRKRVKPLPRPLPYVQTGEGLGEGSEKEIAR